MSDHRFQSPDKGSSETPYRVFTPAGSRDDRRMGALARVVQCERDRSNGTPYLIRMIDMSCVDFEE